MPLILTPQQQHDLEDAAAATSRVRIWKRYRAVLLRGAGLSATAVAQSLGCSEASVYAWTARWRQQGIAGLREGEHGGGQVKLDAAGAGLLEGLLATDPQTHGHRATGWTVPLLRVELTEAGVVVADRTVRRVLHRLGYRWKRPQYVLGRPDPAYAEKRGP
jgi:transposase